MTGSIGITGSFTRTRKASTLPLSGGNLLGGKASSKPGVGALPLVRASGPEAPGAGSTRQPPCSTASSNTRPQTVGTVLRPVVVEEEDVRRSRLSSTEVGRFNSPCVPSTPRRSLGDSGTSCAGHSSAGHSWLTPPRTPLSPRHGGSVFAESGDFSCGVWGGDQMMPLEANPFASIERKGDEVETLALTDEEEQPSVRVVEAVFETLCDLVTLDLPQKDVLESLLTHLTTITYCPAQKELSASQPGKPHLVRLPYFEAVRMQQVRVQETRDVCAHRRRIVERACAMHRRAALLWEGPIRVARQPAMLAATFMNQAVLLWVLALWRVFHAEQKRIRRQKTDMLEQTQMVDTIRPMKCWQILCVNRRCQNQEQTILCFDKEMSLLTAEVTSLNESRRDVASELEFSQAAAERLRIRLAKEVRGREALSARLTATRPQLVRSTLASVLNLVLSTALREAKLNRLVARHALLQSDAAVLLTADEEDVKKLSTLSSEALLGRWVNYHLMQFKLFATKVMEGVARARSDEGVAAGVPSEWSARDADTYCDRCRVVRSLQRIVNFKEDLRDGAVLTVLYASLAITSGGGPGQLQQALSPALLWPLDEKDLQERAVKLCEAFRLVLPTAASRCLLRPADITKGNPAALALIFASLFLYGARLPAVVPGDAVFDYAGETLAVETMCFTKPAPGAEFQGTSSLEENLAETAAGGRVIDRNIMKEVTNTIERSAGGSAYESIQDVSLLLQGESVRTVAPEKVLLRWVSRLLNEEVTHLSDMKSPKKLLDVIFKVAPDVIAIVPEGRLIREAKAGVTDEMAREVVTVAATRLTAFPILTREALRDGKVDVIAAFLAGLMLCRPGLRVDPESTLGKHLQHIDACVRQATLATEGGSREFPVLCSWLKDNKVEFEAALRAIDAASFLQQKLEQRLHTFIADLLSQRAHGNPNSMEGGGDEDKSEGTARIQLVQPSRLTTLVNSEVNGTGMILSEEHIGNMVEHTTDLLRKHQNLLLEVFQFYGRTIKQATQPTQKDRKTVSRTTNSRSSIAIARKGMREVERNMVIDLRGITRMYRDCRLRVLRLFPGDMEAIFFEVRSDIAADMGRWELKADKFMELVLLTAWRGKMMVVDLGEKFAHIIENHLWLYGTGDKEDLFYEMAYSPGISSLLPKFENILRAVFHAFASISEEDADSVSGAEKQPLMPGSAGGSISKHESHDAEEEDFDPGRHPYMNVSGFHSLLTDVRLFGGQLTAASIPGLFTGLRREAVEREESDDSAESDDDDDFDHAKQVRPAAGPPPKVRQSVFASERNRKSVAAGPARKSRIHGAVKRTSMAPQVRPQGFAELIATQEAMQMRPVPEGICFHEFLDALVVVAAHKDPSPFVPFLARFEKFIAHGLLVPLRDQCKLRLQRKRLEDEPPLEKKLLEVEARLLPKLDKFCMQHLGQQRKSEPKSAPAPKAAVPAPSSAQATSATPSVKKEKNERRSSKEGDKLRPDRKETRKASRVLDREPP